MKLEISPEYFDVVDALDRVTGIASRSHIHAKNLYHRAVHVFVFNTQGAVFVQKRSLNKDTAPGKWVSSCSGHLDAGEYYYEAARRELGEEINLFSPQKLSLVMVERPRPETGFEHVHLFRCYAEEITKLHPLEISQGQWIQPERLSRWISERPHDFAKSFIYLWNRYTRQSFSL
tara:strand:- start:204 stop:728 length:525 start_codon:yes stop_codon:yes gene_type:complete